ncbi:MAG TPA: hypothetical protein VLF63_02955, partial [Patescibacteria group bacterium]|nr:hypothetical protein [Patescibacteria group bacterium]
MDNKNNKVVTEYSDIVQNSNLESSTTSVSPPSVEVKTSSGLFSLKHRKRLFFINFAVLVTVGVIGLAAYLFFSSAFQNTNLKNQKSANFKQTQIPVNGLKPNSLLQIGQADKLTINGQVNVGNTLVLIPTSTPGSPVAGQLYFNSNKKAPFYYDGSKFVSLAPQANPSIPAIPTLPQNIVNTIAGHSGDITLSNG